MTFQLEVYQDMLHDMQQKFHSKFHSYMSQNWLKQCMVSSTLSYMSCAIWLATHLNRNSEIRIKISCQNAMI